MKLIESIQALGRGEPVLTAEVVRLVVILAGAAGWTWADGDVERIVGAVAVLASLVVSVVTRRKTTSAANPSLPQHTAEVILAPDMPPLVVRASSPAPVLTLSGWRDKPAP